MADVTSFTERARQKRREEQRNWTVEDERQWIEDHPDEKPLEGYDLTEPEQTQHDPDLVPDIEQYERSEEDEDIDALLSRVGIVEAYNRWAGKGSVDPGSKVESIKVRCPNPAHPDHNPSAWLNTDKDVWVCGGCGMEGGDKFDIAAWRLGFPVPGYKSGKKFPELRRAMAVDLGYVVRKRSSGPDTVRKSEPEPDAASPSASEPEPTDDPSANVTPLRPDPMYMRTADVTEAEKTLFAIPWQRIVPEGTFLRDWMNATTQDDLPEEYHFWTGLTAIGLAIGNDVALVDYSPVYGNLFTTVIGRTSSGKSRAVSHLTRLVREAFPYEYDPANTGVKHIRGAGSGEVIIDSFSEVHEDDVTGAPYTVPVRGLIEFNELAALVGKARIGSSSILKPVLMDFYDHPQVITAASRTHGTIKAVDAFGSCVTTTQPRAIRDLVTSADMDSGFLNRWVFVYGIEKPRVAYNPAKVDISRPVDAARSLKAWAATRRNDPMMVLEEEALDLWVKFFVEKILPMYDPGKTGENEDNPMFGRLALLFKKLILLFAANSKEMNPSVKSVQRAIALWGYIEATYSKASGTIATSDDTELEERILAMINKWHDEGRKGARTSDIYHNVKYRFSREDLKQSLVRLQALGLIEEVTYRTGTRGPARTVWAVSDG